MSQYFEQQQRRRLYVRPERAKLLANRHPWIFSGAIGREEGDADAAIGDLFDNRGELVASGFYSAASQIRLRVITFAAPLTEEILRARIRAAIGKRRPLTTSQTTACRLVHSEGDELSGLVIDRYGDVAVVEITSAGLDRTRSIVAETLREELNPSGILFKNDLPARKMEALPLEDEVIGTVPDMVQVAENGVTFEVALRSGQKTGFFLDQRDNRRLVGELAGGLRVLNLFSYSGGFGVYAARGGATTVEEVDISAPAIDLARRNHEINGSGDRVKYTVGDAFAYSRTLAARGEGFDLIVCDPPAFAKSRGEVDRAARGYKDINLQVLKLAQPGGWIATFSCSGHVSLDLFQKIVFSAAADAGRQVAFVKRLTAGIDHPVSLYCPEGEYLKGFLLRVDR